ncbi:hypothetical protein [Bradyrhizobium guangdongense]|uniref:Uncharacterized protein n=1 Tax=Bradyrhizobium guangdongense TaxID=1325090 RepID=A0AA87WBQ4_9BRAD|nr:hypothetical protein [Bradyrhizobium guangdongense]GGI32279.1 hypothetical protein GCM10010987_68640 [Bradyrhizobium guangdongense]
MAGFRGTVFDIPITRDVELHALEWPSDDDLKSETLGGNRDFSPLGRMGWVEVGITLDEEEAIIDDIAESQDPGTAYRGWFETNEESDEPALCGFDLGTNALAAALSAARCIPFYSCNGGAFDDGHHEKYPLVAFFCPTGIFPFVFAAAEKAGAGLEYNHAGGLSIFARNVDALIGAAAALYERRKEIDAVEGVPDVEID